MQEIQQLSYGEAAVAQEKGGDLGFVALLLALEVGLLGGTRLLRA